MLFLFNDFSNLASQQVEGNERLRRLKESPTTMGLSEEKKAEKLEEHAAKETEFYD